LQIDTDLQALLTSFPAVPTSMTLNDLEPPK